MTHDVNQARTQSHCSFQNNNIECYFFERKEKGNPESKQILKNLLSQKLKVDSRELKFQYNAQGKAFLQNFPLHFNLSHSQDLLVIALSKKSELGIDVENISRKVDYLKIATKHFHKEELDWLKTNDFSPESFFKLWTLKEALSKYLGTSLANTLQNYLIEIAENSIFVYKKDALKEALKVHIESFQYLDQWQVAIVSGSEL